MYGDWIFKKEVQKGRNKANIMVSKTKNEIDGACGRYGGRVGEVHTKFWCENLGEETTGKPRHRREDDFKGGGEGCYWIDLVRDREKWLSRGNPRLDSIKCGEFLD
jgi:hypothetical protein